MEHIPWTSWLCLCLWLCLYALVYLWMGVLFFSFSFFVSFLLLLLRFSFVWSLLSFSSSFMYFNGFLFSWFHCLRIFFFIFTFNIHRFLIVLRSVIRFNFIYFSLVCISLFNSKLGRVNAVGPTLFLWFGCCRRRCWFFLSSSRAFLLHRPFHFFFRFSFSLPLLRRRLLIHTTNFHF